MPYKPKPAKKPKTKCPFRDEELDFVELSNGQGIQIRIKFLVYGLQEFHIRNKCIEYKRTFGGRVQMTQQRTTEGGLTGTDTAGNRDESFPFIYPVKEMVKGLFVMQAQKEVSRIRC